VVLLLVVWVGAKKSFSQKRPACYKMLDRASDLDRYFGTSQGKENYNEILILEEQESICKFF
jgi:hypothetical protein